MVEIKPKKKNCVTLDANIIAKNGYSVQMAKIFWNKFKIQRFIQWC